MQPWVRLSPARRRFITQCLLLRSQLPKPFPLSLLPMRRTFIMTAQICRKVLTPVAGKHPVRCRMIMAPRNVGPLALIAARAQ
jgi:hypothetical protein